ncbi:MAG: glycerol-3-phosphate 1-O-acyltransferase PlsY [Holosporales bacterium]|jgi:glycerol-3-phosphate acyltransferase PlsY|nr:glycerol-3-phosphate 1-O-acyltransferase PlsY [Holosporales bacterium]
MVSMLLLCAIGYLIGSIPTGFLILKCRRGVDIRNVGSHSTGATNVLRTCDKKYAFATLMIDALKGASFAMLATYGAVDDLMLLPMFVCIAGHVYPVWLKFHGGKGVSTAAGIFLVLEPWLTVVSVIVWATVAKVVKVSSLASLSFVGSFVSLVTYRYHAGTITTPMLVFTLVVLGFLLVTHADNIRRLLSHKESSVTGRTRPPTQCKDA